MISQNLHPSQAFGAGLPHLTEAAFRRFSALVTSKLGIRMPHAKMVMMQSRLLRRLRELKLQNFEEYQTLLFDSENAALEQAHFFDLITTNKTEFFREPDHFTFLLKTVLPNTRLSSTHCCTQGQPSAKPAKLMVWSAGCASGEEAYSLAMVLSDHASKHPSFDYSILASDISSRVLAQAKEAIYPQSKIGPIPEDYRKAFLLRGKTAQRGNIRISAKLRAKVHLVKLNLMEETYGIQEPMDLIFFRNVMIYFDRQTQLLILARLCSILKPGGLLFISHTESILGATLPLQQLGPSIFQKIPRP